MSTPPAVSAPAAHPAARHRTADESATMDGQQTGGQSVAELLARLQVASSEGGGRRRRED
jgi:hypothetical protein